MKPKLMALIFLLGFCLQVCGISQAVTLDLVVFNYNYHIYSQSSVSVTDSSGNLSSNANVNWHTDGCGSGTAAHTVTGVSGSVASNAYCDVSPYTIFIHQQGRADFRSAPGGRVVASTSSVTGTPDMTPQYPGVIGIPGYSDGIYWSINPEGAEQLGDLVVLNFSWAANVQQALPGSYVNLTGGQGFAGPAITLGSSTIWSHDAISVGTNSGDFSLSHSGSFPVHIGDIIGIHLGLNIGIDVTGAISSEWGGNGVFIHSMMVTTGADVVPLPSTLLLLGSGLLGLAGLRKFKRVNQT